MATATKKNDTKTEKKSGRGGAKRIEVPKDVTFGVDDKRAQYARLVVFNYGLKQKLIPARKYDVNSVPVSLLKKSVNDLAGGTILNGKDGIELIQELSAKGATDEKVAERGLTTAYAQEVRPFIKRKQLADAFGRRGKKAEPKEEKPAKAEKEAPAEEVEEEAEAPAVAS